MKKLAIVYIAALAFPAGAAYAQDIPNPPSTVSPGNEAVIEQIGTGNTVQTIEGAAGLDQLVNGTGSGNYAAIYQGHTGTDYDNDHNPSPFTYTSNNSKAVVSQTASNAAQNMSVTVQYGDNQTANVTQNNRGTGQFITWVSQGTLFGDGGFQSGSAGNKVTIDQNVTAGSNHVNWSAADAFNPNGGGIAPNFLDPSATVAGAGVWQGGQNGVVRVKQESSGALALVDQAGSGNGTLTNVDIQQTGSAWNTAAVRQNGDNGSVIVLQNGASGLTNISLVSQYSSNSIASVNQFGSLGLNTSTITQIVGAGLDTAYVTQNGLSDNTNSAIITQQGGAYAKVDQASTLAANTATVTQTGANTAYVNQH